MAWVQIQKATQATWDDYEKVRASVGDDAPEGLIYHAAGEQENGRWQSVSIWESEEHFNRFRDEKLMPAAREALGDTMVDAGPPPQEAFETKHTLQP
jgi:heme-degrading monooxygenase HmoA